MDTATQTDTVTLTIDGKTVTVPKGTVVVDAAKTVDIEIPVLAAGTMLGSGALIVMDDTTNVVTEALRLTHFYMHESCGKCTPCREGTRWMYQILSEIQNRVGKPEQLDLLLDICDNMAFKCFCPLGDGGFNRGSPRYPSSEVNNADSSPQM